MVTDPAPRRWPRWLAQVVLGLGVSALAVGGLIAVGNAARESLGPRDRYLLPFKAIECPAPPGTDKGAFLDEVQYLGQLPDEMNILDPTLPDRLRDAFGRHPRVKGVGKITVLPAKRVLVELTFQE